MEVLTAVYTKCDPIAAPLFVHASHSVWGLFLFLLTSNLCGELALDKAYTHWHEESTKAWRKDRNVHMYLSLFPF